LLVATVPIAVDGCRRTKNATQDSNSVHVESPVRHTRWRRSDV